jgi:hypothetical protein
VRDSKSVVQEVQKELLAVVQRGQEQVRKGQDRVRKSQEQARKSSEAVVSVVRTGRELAKAARASRPTLPPAHFPSPAEVRAHAQELAGQAITAQRDLAVKARHAAGPVAERVLTAQRELASKARQAGLDQAAATQRSLAGRVVEVAKAATPIVAEGRTRLTQLVSALQPGHQAAGRADAAATTTATAEPAAPAEQPVAAQVKTPAKPRTRTSSASAAKSRTAKPSTAKTSTAKPSTAKTSTAKPSTARTSTAKPSTAKTSTAKNSTRQAAGSRPRSTPKK